MRIIAGRFRGVRLAVLGKGDAAAHLRPTTDRVRESLFNILCNHVGFEGLRVLDLFAGTGALGLEAMSRGAEHCTFVDNGRTSLKILGDNIKTTKTGAETAVLRCPANRLPEGQPCDLIFMDPPYGKDLGIGALNAAMQQGWIAEQALLVWEDSTLQDAEGWDILTQRNFGGTAISFLERG
ncbi:MAG: 16S rRNA (guanine(966)-N(2))-methyltransferase RsmD [Planktomarina sp.]